MELLHRYGRSLMRDTISRFILWFVQLASLLTILISAWRLLDRDVFALVAACVTLVASLYLEHTSTGSEP